MPINSTIIRLLVLEDNPDDVFLLRTSLRRLPEVQFEIVEVVRVEDAIQALRENTIDAVISDLNLPDSVGVATVRELVANAAGVPIVALTGWEDPVLGAELLQEGVACYWSKDRINGVDLVNAILKIVMQKRANSKD